MNEKSLAKYRQIWYSLLIADVSVEAAQWITWADACILECHDAPPDWLCSLALASTRQAATIAVSAPIDLNESPDALFDSDSLMIGFVVSRKLSGQLTSEEMWRKLAEVSDIAEFLDSGAWRQFVTSTHAISPTSSPLQCLLPVAQFAIEQGSMVLQKSEA
jgi:hypothetical protein